MGIEVTASSGLEPKSFILKFVGVGGGSGAGEVEGLKRQRDLSL